MGAAWPPTRLLRPKDLVNVSVLIATARRPDRLKQLLDGLVAQDRAACELIVIDNDPAGSAKGVVDALIASAPTLPIRYRVESVRNISLARNLGVALASGDCLAFVDDDERVPREWLQRLCSALESYA